MEYTSNEPHAMHYADRRFRSKSRGTYRVHDWGALPSPDAESLKRAVGGFPQTSWVGRCANGTIPREANRQAGNRRRRGHARLRRVSAGAEHATSKGLDACCSFRYAFTGPHGDTPPAPVKHTDTGRLGIVPERPV